MRKAKYPVQTTISLTEHLYAQVKEMSDDREVSFGEQLRDLLELGLGKQANKEDSDDERHTN